MTNLDKLITFWKKVYDEGKADLSLNILTHVLATIGALVELKQIKGGQK